ncbi:MAG: MarR family transcriptional regulator [Candidatus Eremiobacteraeota bacterium]|nr:MarR family transcriptional regulator [Candidatus Eremiobacteraeota bacterium]
MSEDKRDPESFCRQLWDALFDAVDASKCLTRSEKRVLEYLWAEGTVGSWICDNYPGHAPVADKMQLSQGRLESALKRLERKGFIKGQPSSEDGARPRYLLNPLLVEDAYQRTKRCNPGLFRF